ITNIEEDHLDCYSGLDEIITAFREFAEIVPPDGLIIANGADANVAKALANIRRRVETVSLQTCSAWSVAQGPVVLGCHTGIVHRKGKPVATLEMSIAGEHNLFNGAMALAACCACGIPPAPAAKAIGEFR